MCRSSSINQDILLHDFIRFDFFLSFLLAVCCFNCALLVEMQWWWWWWCANRMQICWRSLCTCTRLHCSRWGIIPHWLFHFQSCEIISNKSCFSAHNLLYWPTTAPLCSTLFSNFSPCGFENIRHRRDDCVVRLCCLRTKKTKTKKGK